MNLKEQLAAEVKAAKDITEQAAGENRDLTETEAKDFNTHIERAEELKGIIAKYAGNASKINALAIEEDKVDDEPDGLQAKSLSERYIYAPAYKDYARKVEQHLDPADIRLAKTHIGSLADYYLAKTAPSAITSELAHSQAERLPLVNQVEVPEITLLDLISRGRINSESVEYLQITSVTRNTAIVPENTGNDETDTHKPQSIFGTNLETAKVVDYADGYTITNKMLRDSAMLATYLDGEFRTSFDLKLADMLLNGSGTNGQPKGLLNTTGVQEGEYSKTGDEAMNLVKAIRHAFTQLHHVNGRPNAVLVNPADAEKIDLLQDTTGRFYGNGPWAVGPTTVWSQPIVESESIEEGTVIVGDFRQIALLDRSGLSIDVFNQHKDYADRNLVYVRAELAAAQAIWRPAHFVVLEAKTSKDSTPATPEVK